MSNLLEDLDRGQDHESIIECVVCGEPLRESVTICGHEVHQECIARSGKEQCPVCRHVLTISEQYREQLNEAIELNRRREEEQNRQAAIDIAHQEQDNEEDDEENQDAEPRFRMILLGHRMIQWRSEEVESYRLDRLFEEVARLNYGMPREEIITDRRSLELFRLMYGIAEIAATSNLDLREVIETLLTIWND